MARRCLPDRRRSLTFDLEHKGASYSVCVGLYDDNRPGEIFLTGGKSGSDMGGLDQTARGTASLGLGRCGTPENCATIVWRRRWDAAHSASLVCSPLQRASRFVSRFLTSNCNSWNSCVRGICLVILSHPHRYEIDFRLLASVY